MKDRKIQDRFGRQHGVPPMYDASYEHDNCGIGAIVNIEGIPSHKTVSDALTIVERLEHRAGKDAAGETGDGVGILLQVPHAYFVEETPELDLPADGSFGVGMFFFPRDELKRKQAKKLFETILKKEGLGFLGWRHVPVHPEVLGKAARDCMPEIYQCFVRKPRNVRYGLEFDRKLFIVRRIFEKADHTTYVCSMSCRTIVYKGMFLVGQLRGFYQDLQNEKFVSAIGIVHSRFSTNTFPSWERAHPNRMLVHNGEINTIRGNVNKMFSREETMKGGFAQEDLYKVLPAVDHWASDSAMLDNTIEFLMMAGMDLPKAMMICIPEPWVNDRNMSQKKRDFYQYEATLMEPWDGPASILFSDGEIMGAVLDRNGLRPSRYYITKDGFLILSSEVGVVDLDPANIVKKDRLRPGRMLLVDTREGRIISDDELKMKYAEEHPYGEWLEDHLTRLSDIRIPNRADIRYSAEQLSQQQTMFGYTFEDINWYLKNTAIQGEEPIVAMGTDAPLPFLSRKNPPLFNYFKQLFAQVTNPPIDAIREEMVTSTHVYLGASGNLLHDTPENCQSIRVRNPILTNTDMLKIRYMKKEGYQVRVIPITYYKGTPLEDAMEDIFLLTDRAIRDGANILILSDREVDEYHVPVPSLLAVSAVQQHLVRTKNRTQLSLVLESGEPREVHHFAALLGYGASAVNPYLALDSIKDLIDRRILDKDYYAASEDYCDGILAGVLRIASKMGISTIQSYMGAQIFEAVGIDQEVIDRYFTNTVSPIGGITMKDIEEQLLQRHNHAFDPLGLRNDLSPESVGFRKSVHDGEKHLYNPAVIHAFQKAVRTGDYELFRNYSSLVTDRDNPVHIRDLMSFRFPERGIPVEEVEPVSSIVKRFKVGAMSYGALSLEAHETLAIAMNELGGRSNTGEGGENENRFTIGKDGKNRNSAIKQVASARFGVTSAYLVSAKEIQIKMAQGAKPGEGGHLPGSKVYPEIAATRYSTPGVGLISPPPHHDIYSIEDLAQLIYDLKSANSLADINVKLVSEAGVGTVAAGVAKAGAEKILVSGYDGGTGAAPANSVSGAGLPWELGLAEAHQTLMMNGLRGRVTLETDGKLMTGRDVAIAALLGAEEFGFATLPMVAMGCVMMRVCNRDSCPVGIATQNPELRKCFRGKPEHVKNGMLFIAQELREYMAKLGFRTVDEMVGRTDFLDLDREMAEQALPSVDLSVILDNPYIGEEDTRTFSSRERYDFRLRETKDETVLNRALESALESGRPEQIDVDVSNTDRAFGTAFGSRITRKHGNSLPENTYRIRCKGAGGQSFGAFIPKGMTLELCGDANDYVGKGLSGGNIIVYPPKGISYRPEDNIIIGNVALYGATSGKLFVNGCAGERFCVRNSGARAVVEGVGNHGIEYMTGGCVVILGPTGENLAAGMSGGVAYVLDETGDVYMKLNRNMVSLEKMTRNTDVAELKAMIEEHVRYTDSPKGKKILASFEEYLPKFKKIMPHDYKRMLDLVAKYEQKGMSRDQAVESAFYEYEGGER